MKLGINQAAVSKRQNVLNFIWWWKWNVISEIKSKPSTWLFCKTAFGALLGDFIATYFMGLDKKKKNTRANTFTSILLRNSSLDFRWRNGIWMVYIGISLNTRSIDLMKLQFQNNKTKRVVCARSNLHLISIAIIVGLYKTCIDFTAFNNQFWYW
jgi:hypothetical protein